MLEEAALHGAAAPDFRLGEWLVQPSLNRLTARSRSVQLEPRTMDVLAYLARHAGRVVPREEILEAVWKHTFVADATLSHAVAELRRALGDSAQRPRYIETVSKRGYRIVAATAVAANGVADAMTSQSAVAGSARTSGTPSVAVLPFEDMSVGRDQEYLCDGIAEELTNALANLDGLRVAARTSSFAFKGKLEDVREIGRRLGVDAVLEGSVRKAGDRLRVTVQLVNVADGLHLWSERFDRSDEDIFAIQDEIALGVVGRLKVRLLAGEASLIGRRNTASREAYDHYLRGRHLLGRRRAGELTQAIGHFEQAIAVDGSYALPHVAIAETFSTLALWGFAPPRPALDRARAAAVRALEIDDSLAEAHAWLGIIYYYRDWDWQRGDHRFAHALSLPRPGWPSAFGLGIHHMAGGRYAEAAAVARRLVEAEPLSSVAHTQAASLLVGMCEFDAAAAMLDRALELDPDQPMALFWMGFSKGVLGRVEEAAEMLRRGMPAGFAASGIALPAVLVRAGQRDAAATAVAAIEHEAERRYVSPVTRALAWAALDERDRALALLAEAETERSPMLVMAMIGPGYLKLSPDWVAGDWIARLRDRVMSAALSRRPGVVLGAGGSGAR